MFNLQNILKVGSKLCIEQSKDVSVKKYIIIHCKLYFAVPNTTKFSTPKKVRELVKLSDYLELPVWDAAPLLTALEEAILFPSRKSSNQKLANPGDIAGLLKPKKTVPRKVSKRNVKLDKGKVEHFYDNLKNRENSSEIYRAEKQPRF